MRSKEYIIFLIIFTVIYIIFFIIYDALIDGNSRKKALKKAESLVKIEEYLKFANFYGLQSSISKEIIMSIYNELKDGHNYLISDLSNKYSVSNCEIVIITLYLEYLNLIIKKKISLEDNHINNTTYIEQNLIQKYLPSFQNKSSIDIIVNNFGNNSINDIVTITSYNLVPGVRLIDNKLYYVGDYL